MRLPSGHFLRYSEILHYTCTDYKSWHNSEKTMLIGSPSMRYIRPWMWYVPTSYTYTARRGLRFCTVVGYSVLDTVSKFGWPSTYRLWDIPPLSGMKYDVNSKISKLYRIEGGLVRKVTRGSMPGHFRLIDSQNPPSVRYERSFLLYLMKLIIWPSIPHRGGIYTTLKGRIVRYFIIWHFIVD